MFDFLSMANTYEQRKVDRFEQGDLIISTAKVTDSLKPYETAVSHPLYNSRSFVIVENYMNLEDAKEGHERWVEIMTSDNLPETLTDVSEASVARLLRDLSGGTITRVKKEN